MSYFKEMSPESQGIDSGGIIKFLEETDRRGLELHRLMILRHGICVAKGTWDPYREEDLHPVYSFTKSLTSTAIGFAIREGLLSLEDHLTDFFPEEIPDPEEFRLPDGSIPVPAYPSAYSAGTLEDILENLKEVTIHHLLSMSCGQETETEDVNGPDWIHSFFRQPFLYKPGTFYKYNTAGTNMLCAILKKRTGLDLTEYLQSRLFDPLDMGEIFCHRLPDPMGVQMGGGGMKLTLENMAKFAYFMLQDGCWEGEAILPGWYSLMGSRKIETAGDSEGHIEDWAQGYGYQCWIGKQPGSFRADGAFGQFGLVYPHLDLIIITNAATEQTQSIMDAVNSCILPSVDAQIVPEEEKSAPPAGDDFLLSNIGRKQHILAARLRGLKLPALKKCHNPTQEALYGDKTYDTEGRCSGLEVLIGGAGLGVPDTGASLKEMSFTFEEDKVIWKVRERKEKGQEREYIVKASLEGTFLRSYCQATGSEVAATARWRSLHALEMEIRRMDTMSGADFIFRFQGDRVCMEVDETLMTDGGLGMVEKEVCSFRKRQGESRTPRRS